MRDYYKLSDNIVKIDSDVMNMYRISGKIHDDLTTKKKSSITKTVYRIETKDGQGMYRRDDEITSFLFIDDPRHPVPTEDSELRRQSELRAVSWDWDLCRYRFAFGDINQLRNWLYRDTWLRQLHNAGFVMTEYTCSEDDIIIGNTQALFKDVISHVHHSIIDYFGV
jgi:hypothetical protein